MQHTTPNHWIRIISTLLLLCLLNGCTKLPFLHSTQPSDPLPTTETILGWIASIEEQGYRRPGWPADEWTENWAVERFNDWGLQDVTREPIQVRAWKEKNWSLEVWPKGQPNQITTLASWPIPLAQAVEGFVAELALSRDPSDIQPGTIAVVEYPLMEFSLAQMRDEVATWSFDPSNDFDSLKQVVPMGTRFQKVMDAEIAAGAAGYIGILDFPWNTDRYYVPYDDKPRPAPGLYLSRSEGDKLLQLMQQGSVMARLSVTASLSPAINHNIYASLPGQSDEWIVIGSHHDGPWHSAVEDASGVAMVMAQARYWSQIPQEQRPHNLLFLLNGGHMSHGAGLQHFAKTHHDFLSREVVAEIHLEHLAREAQVVNGELVPTDKPEVRWWFTSYIPKLESIVADAICTHELERSLIMPSTNWPRPGQKRPPTDASLFFLSTPVISLLAAPMYLFDPADRLNMVDEKALRPVSLAVIDMIQDLGKESAAGLRAQQYQPPSSQRLPSGCIK